MKTLNQLSLFTLITLMLPVMGTGQQQYSLQQAQDYAIKNAFNVKSTIHDAESAKLSTDELIGIGLPQVNASVNYQNYIDLPTSLVPAEFFGGEPGEFAKLQFGTPHNMTVGLSATQLLFDGSWLIGLQASKAYAALKQKEINKSEKQVKQEVAGIYHLALIADENVALLRQNKEVVSTLLRETKELWKAGFVEEQDAEQLQLTLNTVDNAIAYAEQQASIARNLLKFSMGLPIATDITLTDTAKDLIPTGTELTQVPFNVETDMDVQLVQGGLGMQELNLKNYKAKRLPNLGAFYNLQTQAQRNEFSFFDTSEPWYPVQIWGLQLNVPVFSGLTKSKGIQKTKVEVQRLSEMLALTKEAVQLEYTSAKSEFEMAYSNYNNNESSLELANRILDKTRIKFKEGMTSSFEVNQIHQQVLSTQNIYVKAMLDLLNAKTRLQKALNQL